MSQIGDFQLGATSLGGTTLNETATSTVTATGAAEITNVGVEETAQNTVTAASTGQTDGEATVTNVAPNTLGAAQLGERTVGLANVVDTVSVSSDTLPVNYPLGTASVESDNPTAGVEGIADVSADTVEATATSDVNITAITDVDALTAASVNSSGVVSAVANPTATSSVQSDSLAVVTFPLSAFGSNYYIGRAEQDINVVANGATGGYPDITIGETTTFSLLLKDPQKVTPDVAIEKAEEGYDTLKNFEKYAGYAQTGRTIDSVFYSEPDIFPLSPIDSLLVSVEPGDDIDEARAIWGVVESINDTTEVFGAVARIELEVFVVAEFDDYADKQAVQNDVEANL
jgi:hypothetical protein